MKPTVIKEMKTDEIRDRIGEEKEALNKLRLNHAVAPIEDPMSMRVKKKIIARLETELQARAINTEKQ